LPFLAVLILVFFGGRSFSSDISSALSKGFSP
jgi:hypothetical protein